MPSLWSFGHDEAASPRPIKFENWPASPPSEEGRENEPPDEISLEFGFQFVDEFTLNGTKMQIKHYIVQMEKSVIRKKKF